VETNHFCPHARTAAVELVKGREVTVKILKRRLEPFQETRQKRAAR